MLRVDNFSFGFTNVSNYKKEMLCIKPRKCQNYKKKTKQPK